MFLPPGFDKALALEAGALVTQAYDQYEKFTAKQPWALQGSYQNMADLSAKPEGLIAHPEPFGFVARSQSSGHVFVVFRGTQSLDDWLCDFSFPQVPHPWGRVERGFTYLYEQCAASVQNGVKAAVAAGGGAAPKVIVTGHSLGAGLALLATADLVSVGAVMYSFAGPRVGDPAFATEFNQQVPAAWRIVNTEDIVTTVPLATPALVSGVLPGNAFALLLKTIPQLNYEHCGSMVGFTSQNGSIAANHAMLQYLAAFNAT